MSEHTSRKRRHDVEGPCDSSPNQFFDMNVSEANSSAADSSEINVSTILADCDTFVMEGIPLECPFNSSKNSNHPTSECTLNISSEDLDSSFVNDKNVELSGNPFPVCEESASQSAINRSMVSEVSSPVMRFPDVSLSNNQTESLNVMFRVGDHLKEIDSSTSKVIKRLDFNNLFSKESDKNGANKTVEFAMSENCGDDDGGDFDCCTGNTQDFTNRRTSESRMQPFSTPLKTSKSLLPLLEAMSPIDSPESGQSDSEDSMLEQESGSDSSDSDINEGLLSMSFLNSILDENVECSKDGDTFINRRQDNISKALMLNDIKIHGDSDLSVNEAISLIMNLYVKNFMSKSGLKRAIDTICKFLPEDHKVPASCHKILSYIEGLASPVKEEIHYYCKECLFYHGLTSSGVCSICNSKVFGRFFNFDIDDVLKYFFENRNLAEVIDSRKPSSGSCLRDITDGSVYKSLNANRNPYDVNLIVNSDGVRIRKISDSELWLVLSTIAEVPIHLQKSFMIVLGVWYGPIKPDMKTFLKPFAEKMRALDKRGVVWTDPISSEVVESRVRLLALVCDAPARAMIQNLLYFNGTFGCNLCEIKTVKSTPIPEKKCIRIYPYQHNIQLRTKERMIDQALRVGDGKHVKGVKGPSVLSIIPSVDVSVCMVPEYMHSVLIGVVKQIMVIWTQKQCTLRAKISEIDQFLVKIKHPEFVHRIQRQIKSLKYWKASDFYYFLLFESLPVLCDYLPDANMQHFLLLVKGIFTLLKGSISEPEILEADLLLKLFVNNFAELYGDRELTHNLHQLCHLGLCVSRYGPLFCHSAFIFEDMNGLVAKKTHGTNYVDKEIVRNIIICSGIQILNSIVSQPKETEAPHFVCELLGSEVSIPLSREDLAMLNTPSPKIYSRAKIGFDVFTSEIYKTLKTANYYAMLTINGIEKYVAIRYFAETMNGICMSVRLFEVNHTKVFYNTETLKTIAHIIPITCTEEVLLLQVTENLTIVKVGKIGSYIYKRPNLYHSIM